MRVWENTNKKGDGDTRTVVGKTRSEGAEQKLEAGGGHTREEARNEGGGGGTRTERWDKTKNDGENTKQRGRGTRGGGGETRSEGGGTRIDGGGKKVTKTKRWLDGNTKGKEGRVKHETTAGNTRRRNAERNGRTGKRGEG